MKCRHQKQILMITGQVQTNGETMDNTTKTKLEVIGNGKTRRYKITGPIEVVDAEGNITTFNRGVLCGCGYSKTGIFCDGSHNVNPSKVNID